jgi:hypothetical protein
MFKMKKIKFCFKTEDYESLDLNKYIAICLDKLRIFYGIKFKMMSNKIKKGVVPCQNTGYLEECEYVESTFYIISFYYKNYHMKKGEFFKMSSYTIKEPVNVQKI